LESLFSLRERESSVDARNVELPVSINTLLGSIPIRLQEQNE